MGRKPRRTLANPNIAIAYLRVSTTRERQELGEEAQRSAIATWAKKEGVEIVEWFVEEVSGGAALDKRPVLLDAITAVSTHHAGILVVAKIDRFSRDSTTAAVVGLELTRAGARLVSANGEGNGDDPANKMMRSILVAVAEYERAIIKARIRAALAVKKARGELTGQAPFGMRAGADGKTLEPDPGEQAIIAQARELRASGLTLRAVQAELAAHGIVGRARTPLSLPTVHGIVRDQSSMSTV